MPFWVKIAILDQTCHIGSKLPYWIKNAILDQNCHFQSKLPFWIKIDKLDWKCHFGSKLKSWTKNLHFRVWETFLIKSIKIFSRFFLYFLLKLPLLQKLEVQDDTVIIWFHSGNGITMLKFRNPEGNLIKNIYWVISFFSLILYFPNLTAYLKFLVQ